MIWNSFQREDDDSVFTIARNVAGTAVVAGYPVYWDIATSADGVRVTKAATDNLAVFRGIAVEAIADSAYGKVQVHGFCSAAAVYPTSTTAAVAGWPLTPIASQWYMTAGIAAGTGKADGFVYHAEANATVATTLYAVANKKVLVRAM